MKDSHRVILAVALSALVFVGWNFVFGPPKPTAPKPTPTETAPTVPAPQAPVASAPPAAPAVSAVPGEAVFDPAQGRRVTVKTPLYEAVFSSQGGVLERFALLRYHESIAKDSPLVDLVSPQALAKAPMGVIVGGVPSWRQAAWTVQGDDLNLASGEGRLAFVGELAGLRLTRTLTFKANSYLVEEALTVANVSGAPLQSRVAFTLATRSLSSESDSYNLTRVAYLAKGSLTENHDAKELTAGVQQAEAVGWGALQSNYFLLGLIPLDDGSTFKAKLEDGIYRLAMEKPAEVFTPGVDKTYAMSYFLGPKEKDQLAAAPNNLDRAVDLGFFGFISKPLTTGLDYIYQYVGNYGVAIIILTILIKLILWPLSHKSYKSMDQMKKIQPLLQNIREKYADDRQKMNDEMMALYKTYKVNPAGGCLPIMLQIPVFFGLYNALLGAVELRHAPFIPTVPFTDLVWLADLSAKDPYYVTPLVMGATMFIQQKMTPAPGDPTQAKIMLFMPIVFTFMFLNFPSGLVVYWLVNNVLSIAQQWYLTREKS